MSRTTGQKGIRMPKIVTTYCMTGTVDKDIYGRWEDVEKGYWIGKERLEPLLNLHLGNKVKLILETIDDKEEEA